MINDPFNGEIAINDSDKILNILYEDVMFTSKSGNFKKTRDSLIGNVNFSDQANKNIIKKFF